MFLFSKTLVLMSTYGVDSSYLEKLYRGSYFERVLLKMGQLSTKFYKNEEYILTRLILSAFWLKTLGQFLNIVHQIDR